MTSRGFGEVGMRRFTAAELDIGHVPVTQGLAPAPSLSEALLRECRDMGPTLESRVSGPLGRHGVLVWAGCGGRIFMLCYVMFTHSPWQWLLSLLLCRAVVTFTPLGGGAHATPISISISGFRYCSESSALRVGSELCWFI